MERYEIEDAAVKDVTDASDEELTKMQRCGTGTLLEAC